MNLFVVVLLGVFGSLVAEAFKQQQKWRALTEAKFRAQFGSWKFWALVFLLTVSGGASAYFLYDDAGGHLRAEGCVAAGAGAQAFFRSLAASGASEASNHRHLKTFAAKAEDEITWGDILS